MKKKFTKLLMLLGVFLFLGAGSASADGYSDYYFKLVGGHNGWETSGNPNIQLSYDGLAICENFGGLKGNKFKVLIWNPDADKNQWHASDKGSVPIETWVNMSGEGTDMNINGDGSNKSWNLYWDEKRHRLWVGNTTPSFIYIVGNVNGTNSFQPNIGNKLTGSNGVYKGRVNLGNGSGDAYFSFSIALGDETDNSIGNWNSLAKRFGAGSKDLSANISGGQNKATGDGNNSFKVPSGEYDITFNWSDKSFTLTPVQNLNTYSVYFNNMAKWEKVYVYTFEPEKCGDWPGTELTRKADGSYQWDYQAPTTPTFGGIIFNNGKEGDAKKQTDNLTYSVGATYNNANLPEASGTGTNVYLQGSFNGWKNLPEYEFAVNNDNEYKLSVTLDAGPHTLKVFYNGALRGYIPMPEGYNNTPAENKDLMFDYKDKEGGQDFELNLSQKSIVNFYYKKEYKTYANNNTYYWTSLVYSTSPVIEFEGNPETLYLYGHVNGGYWKYNNYIPLTKGDDGKYYAKNAEISGLWKQKDVDLGKALGQDRELDKSSGDLNYVAVYTEIAKNDDFDDPGKGLYKFGSVDAQNNEDNNTNCRVDNLNGKTASLLYQGPRDRNNFLVKGGIYNITVDLENMTITFEEVIEENKPAKVQRTFNWWYGNDEDDLDVNATLIEENTANIDEVHSNFDNHAYHTYEYGQTGKNIIQVGIKTMPEHRLAQQASYTIWYANPSYTPSGIQQNVKRRAATNGELDYTPAEAITELPETLSSDFHVVTPNSMDSNGNIVGNPNAEVTTIGSDNLGDNYLLQLNKAGYYIITADVKDKYDSEGYNYDVTPSSIFINATQADFSSVASIGTSTATFKDQTSTYTLNGFLELSEKLIKDTDFTVTVEPDETAGSWVNNTWTYEKALNVPGSTLFKQYSDLNAVVVDGLYTGIKNPVYTEAIPTNNPYGYNLSADFPCSGVYNITATAKENSNYTGSVTGTFTIVPNLYGTFGTGTHADKGFNIEGYTFASTTGNVPTIKIPASAINGFLNNIDKKYIEHVNAFIPGTYFPSVFTENETAATAEGESNNASYAPNADNYKTGIDLSSLKEGKDHTITVHIAKNGAKASYNFLVTKDDDFTGSTTGVDTIGAEDNGEAVYYNLQGVRVMNPEKGIFIKVANGRSEKVVL